MAIMMLSSGPLRGSVIGASTLLRHVDVLMPMMCHSCSSSSSSTQRAAAAAAAAICLPAVYSACETQDETGQA
jgi:hypothetical protein